MFVLPADCHRYPVLMPEPVCPGCRDRDALIADLQRQLAELAARVRDLEQRLAANATNSSLPPSANPPSAPKPVAKRPTGKKRGARPGHEPHLKRRLPAGRLTAVVDFRPRRCDRCHRPLPARAGPGDPEPSWHQVAELPQMAAAVTEYRGHYCTCPDCGTLNHAPIPAAIKAHSVGPRLAATLAYLAGGHRLSKRGLEEVARDVFDVPVSLGTVANLEARVSAALAPAHAGALAAVRAAGVKNVDETGWKLAGKLRWLWVAATDGVAAFLIHARRGWEALTALLGEKVRGLVCSDRWSAYGRLSPYRRQVCWAHLKRDFQKLVDRGGPAGRLGEKLQRVAGQVFEQWHLFRGGGIDRAELQRRLDGPAQGLERLLRSGRRCADAKAAAFCANVLGLVPAVWRFAVSAGVEPTNNHAERLLRRGVLWRKSSFGCQSASGCRFVERLLTAVQTCRLQGRSVLQYLYQAVSAHRSGLPAPSLLPTR
jgi:transposase